MIRRNELADPRSCINKAADDEPVFVLRGQDALAPILVRLWADLAELHGCPDAKTQGAKLLSMKMQVWAVEHGGKYPD